jgi:hypothetical protein
MRVAEMFTMLVGTDSPVAIKAYDGSSSGPLDPVATIEVNPLVPCNTS